MDEATTRPLARPAKPGRNALLAALPAQERELLTRELEPVELTFKQVLEEPGRPIGHVWFPRSGVTCMFSQMEDGSAVEVATLGREGFVGLPIVLGAQRMAHRVLVQIPGEGDRIPAAALTALLPRLPALHRVMLRCALALVTQIAQGSACNRLHPVEQRCARWLLMTHDRVDGDSFPLTQEFLGQMLGITRPSVSIAAGMLQRAGLVRYARGVITVLDRAGLEEAACECYRLIADEFRRLAGSEA
jgi:CRP-like cAMP-binding protein